MPQNSAAYAAGRISMLRRDALDSGRLERLMAASDLNEATRTLSEIGWSSAEGTDWEKLADDKLLQASRTLRELSTDPELTDCYLLRYDVANLKMLLKARCLNQRVDSLSECGTIPVEKLRHAVSEHSYQDLPMHLRSAMNQLEKEIAVSVDPMMIDVRLDHALYTGIFEMLKQHPKEKSSQDYFNGKADQANLMTVLRLIRMGKDAMLLQRVLLPYGTVNASAWTQAFAEPERLPELLRRYGAAVVAATREAVASFAYAPKLEKAMDNALLRLFAPYQYEPMRKETLLTYWIGIEREVAAVRLIMAGIANGFSQEAIRERLRDLYG